MKKLFGEGGFMGFLARHCEKMVFAVAVLLVIWVALPNSERKPIDESVYGADVLKQKADQTRDKITNTNSWEEVLRDKRFGEEEDFFRKSKQDLEKIDVALYTAPVPLNKPIFPEEQERRDPVIYPIKNINVAVTYGPLALNDSDADRDAAAADEIRAFPPETAEYVQTLSSVPAGAKLAGRYVVAVTGRVPIREQIEEYIRTFAETDGYNETRDTQPVYGAHLKKEEYQAEEVDGTRTPYGPDYYLVERAEILPDGSVGETKSQYVASWGRARGYRRGSRYLKYLSNAWAGGGATAPSAGGHVDPRYVDERFASPVPPLAMRDLEPVASHPMFPSAAEAAEAAADTGNDQPDVLGGGPGEEGSGTPDARPTPRPNTPRPGSRPIRGGREGVEGGGITTMHNDVDFLLFRYYDMDAEPGKSYRYRVRLVVEDPNFPQDETMRPKVSTLAASVIERLKSREDQEAYWRFSDYSDPSPVATIPKTKQTFVGPVDPGKTSRPPQRDFEIRLSEKTTKAISLVWDEEKALDIPGVVDASRGTVLNFTADVEAIDPVANGLRKLPEYRFDTDTVVLDIRGGDWYSTKKEQSIPGEVLILDDEGNLVVRSEVEDAEEFGHHVYPEEKVAEDPVDGGRPPQEGRPPRGGGGEEIDFFGS